MSKWKLHHYSGEERVVSNPEEILEELEILGNLEEPTTDLISESGDCLTVSVSGPLALIIFRRASLDPPYLSPVMAGRNIGAKGELVEFTIGGTPTPVPRHRCVSVSTMLKIVRHYLEQGKLPTWIEWGDQ
jgi:hypothetical protein